MPCWHIDEENCWHVDANTQRPLWLEGNPICWVSIVIKVILNVGSTTTTNPQDRTTRKTNFARMGSMMMTLVNVRISSTKTTMPTRQHVD
jgi:hypothetical protein